MTPLHAQPVQRFEAACARWVEDPLLQFLSALAVGVVLGVGSGTQLYVNWTMGGAEASYVGLLTVEIAEWSLWAAAVPLIVRLDRAVDWSAGWVRPVLVHGVAATAIFLVVNAPVSVLVKLGEPSASLAPFGERYLFRIAYRLPSAWFVYAVALTAAKLVHVYVRSRRLDRDLAQAQLRALRDQLQPHFLFNTLHTVGSLVRAGDRDGAVETVVGLADLLRRSLNHGGADSVALDEELDFLDRYLDIQRRRFGDHLAVEVGVPVELRRAEVPPFLVQPLVENAIRHGLDLDRHEGTVRIDAARDGGRLVLSVEDSGGCLDEGPGDGTGLANLRSRLRTLYGTDGTLTAAVDGTRTVLTVTLPFRESGP